MKKTNIRKTMIAVLAAAMCATGAVIPAAANTTTCYHKYVHVAHGSPSSRSGDSQCCYYIDYFQCVYECSWCHNSTMGNHTEGRPHTMDQLYYEAHHVYMQCSNCSYVDYNS